MNMAETNGVVSKVNFNFKVQNVSQLKEINSPDILVQGVPWNVQITKKTVEAEDWLAIYLVCQKKEMPENWSHAAVASFKLISFIARKPVMRVLEPFAFYNKEYGRGVTKFIKWNDLLNVERGYVKNDAITLEIEIEAEDPNDKSRLTFENIETCCEENCIVSYRLTITNIDNLMAVLSPQFTMRKLPWRMQVYKGKLSELRFRLRFGSTTASSKLKLLAKLISSNDEKTFEKVKSMCFKANDELAILLVFRHELTKAENGFVKDNSIVIEVEMKASKPEGIVNGNKNGEATSSGNAVKRCKIECSICFKSFADQGISTTKCGHLFCTNCITDFVTARKLCPTCNDAAALNELNPIFLPFVD